MLKITTMRNNTERIKYINFERNMKESFVFSLNDIKKFYPDFDKRRLYEWKKKGYINSIIKGYYMFSDIRLDEKKLFFISNTIYQPSYISLESALSYYGLIPENVLSVVSVSSKKTMKFDTKFVGFIYRHIKPEIFYGYKIIKFDDKYFFKIAEPFKAVIDYLYLNEDIQDERDFKELRINHNVFLNIIKPEDLISVAQKMGEKFSAKVKKFIRFIKNG